MTANHSLPHNCTPVQSIIFDNRITILAGSKGLTYIHREQIASAANALLMALANDPAGDGVVMLATALGCEVKR
jgi:hypothetical protein